MITARHALLSLALLVAPSRTPAADLFSWHSVDQTVLHKGRWELLAHSRLRTFHEFHDLNQFRAGPILRAGLVKRLTGFGGYFWQPVHALDGKWHSGHRVFGGVEWAQPLGQRSLTNRLIAEHHEGGNFRAYNRYRTWSRLAWSGRVAPYLQNEWLFVRQGFHSVRNSGGLRLRLNEWVVLEMAYLYDIRRTVWGGDRQAVITGLRIERFGKH